MPTKVAMGSVLLAALLFKSAFAQTIELAQKDATVWAQEQVVRGSTTGNIASGVLHHNGTELPFGITDEAFSVDLRLEEGTNTIVACNSDATVCSDTLRFTLGYRLRPEAFAYATVEGRTVTLYGQVLANPDSADLTFSWQPDPENPQVLSFTTATDTVTTFVVPDDAAAGEYYFDFHVAASDGDEALARTFVTVDSSGVVPFGIWTDHASWVDAAVIYEVTPYNFTSEGKLVDVIDRLPELELLGVNTLWIQPVFETAFGGQGYDITNYFKVRSDYGTEEDLRRLVDDAHARGMRVLLDFVPNHTSIRHPYAQDAIAYGDSSHYFDFYQREEDDARYSGDYHQRTDGNMVFIYYFWEDLVNLNYHNPEVQRWMTEAGRYWIEEFDIDGYRIDAVWGVNARTPEAMQQWRFDLKRIKPEVLLLGEDKATRPESFDRRFDVAYDWYPEEYWVSHWTWQTDFSWDSNPTIFNYSNEAQRAVLLRQSLTNKGQGFHPDAKVLRFMENNDTFRFIVHHGVDRTKMAATLLFSLPGVPLIYNGQEVGYDGADHPYETYQVYGRARSIADHDDYGLYPLYVDLILLRAVYPALYSDNFEEVDVGPDDVDGHVYAYRRWKGDQHVFGMINMADWSVTADLALPVTEMELDATQTYYVTDLLTGEAATYTGSELATVSLPLDGHTTRLFIVTSEPVSVPTTVEPSDEPVPVRFVLEQNYPNPFNPVTVIPFELPRSGHVRLRIFDVLGREVETLVDGVKAAGRYTVSFDGAGLPSGTYFYRLEHEAGAEVRTMLLVK